MSRGAERVVVINDLLARALWSGQDPIGKRLRWGRSVVWTVVGVAIRQMVAPALAGLAIGLAGASAVTRLPTSYLVEVQATDGPTFGVALGLLVLAVLGASLIPAWQALRIDPVDTLRAE
jgi:ABC-type lipoprotein release transport system permease subunit